LGGLSLSVKIRLRRIGAKKHPFYRLVVADTRSPRDGKFIEILGTYDPMTEPVKLNIDEEKIKAWLQKGARPSDTARAFLIGRGGRNIDAIRAVVRAAALKNHDRVMVEIV